MKLPKFLRFKKKPTRQEKLLEEFNRGIYLRVNMKDVDNKELHKLSVVKK